MNRSQLRDVVSEITNRTDKTNLINSAIDMALSEVGQRHDFREMRVTEDIPLAAGDLSCGLNGSLFHLITITLVDGVSSYGVELRTKPWFVQRFPNPSASGATRPTHAYVEGTTLYFQAPMDTARTIRVTYTKLPPPLLTDASTPLIAFVDNCVIAWASCYVFRAIQMFQEALEWQKQFEMGLMHAIKADIRVSGTMVVSDQYQTSPRRQPDPLEFTGRAG